MNIKIFIIGDEYVDWVGIDGYNHGTTYSWSTWQSAAEIFGPTYDVITSITNKPIMIGEMGCAEAGGNKSQWLYQVFFSIFIEKEFIFFVFRPIMKIFQIEHLVFRQLFILIKIKQLIGELILLLLLHPLINQ